MADIIAFPARPESAPDGRYRSEGTVGSNAGISVRILSRVATPHDLLVVLHGTADGCTTIAAVPAGERAVADVIAHSTLATLMAAETTWRQQSGAAVDFGRTHRPRATGVARHPPSRTDSR